MNMNTGCMMNIDHDLENQPVDLKDHYYQQDQEQLYMQNKKHVRVRMYFI